MQIPKLFILFPGPFLTSVTEYSLTVSAFLLQALHCVCVTEGIQPDLHSALALLAR